MLIFTSIFLIFGPIINFFFVSIGPFDFLSPTNNKSEFELSLFLKIFVEDVKKSFEIIYTNEKNVILLAILTPFFFLNKNVKFKKEYLIIFFLIFEPIFLFSISGDLIPQLRYFAGVNCVILILTGIVFNELYKLKNKFLISILIIFNFFFIFENFKSIIKINEIVSKNHSFYNFNKNTIKNTSKVLYLVDLNIQENLKQNLFYKKIFENNLIEKNQKTEKLYKNIEKKIDIIENTKNIELINEELKNDIIYYNYSYFPIKNYVLFFDHIKKNFDYVLIEESIPFYLTNRTYQNEIKSFLKNNFTLDTIQFNEKKIFLRSQETVIHFFANSLIPHEYAENIDNKKLEIIYGSNYSLYKLN